MTAPLVLANTGAAWTGAPGNRTLRRGIDVVVEDGAVSALEPGAPRPAGARIVAADGWLVLPGFVNGHHHLSQQLTRLAALDGGLTDWLTELYPLWVRVDAETAYHGARVGLAEVLLTGVTTVSDFTYLYPRGSADIFDAHVRAAQELGCRFYPVRGGIAELEAAVEQRLDGRLAPYLEDRDALLSEIERVVARYHDPGAASRCRVGVGLTEKAYHDPALMRELAELAEHRDLRLHTHLHPRPDERELAEREHGVDPVAFLDDTGWWSDRLWVAHGTGLRDPEVQAMAQAGVGLCTCPSSNARFGLGIAPAWDLARAGGKVAVGVDGAASNDGGDYVGECRLTWQAQRIRAGARSGDFAAVTADTVLEWATAGGAAVLDWPELGHLTVGAPADIACFDLAQLDYAGAPDPLAGLLLCGTSHRAALVCVGGEVVVEGGRLVRADEEAIASEGHAAARALHNRAGVVG